MTHWTDKLKEPCDDGLAWARGFPTAQAAWEACERLDWMLWLLRKTVPHDDMRFRVFALECARAVEHLGSPACRETLDVAERHICGEASGAELTAACSASATASWAASWAAWAAAGAARAAWAAAAAWDAARAAMAAGFARDAAGAASDAQCHLLRSFWPEVPL